MVHLLQSMRNLKCKHHPKMNSNELWHLSATYVTKLLKPSVFCFELGSSWSLTPSHLVPSPSWGLSPSSSCCLPAKRTPRQAIALSLGFWKVRLPSWLLFALFPDSASLVEERSCGIRKERNHQSLPSLWTRKRRKTMENHRLMLFTFVVIK